MPDGWLDMFTNTWLTSASTVSYRVLGCDWHDLCESLGRVHHAYAAAKGPLYNNADDHEGRGHPAVSRQHLGPQRGLLHPVAQSSSCCSPDGPSWWQVPTMFIPLACVNEPISISSLRQSPVYTVKLRWRLPAVRVSCVLAAPERRMGSPRSGFRSLDGPSWWGSSGLVARKLSMVWSSMVETQRLWSQTSYQTLQRVGSTILRSASLDKLISAAGGGEPPSAVAAGAAAAEEDEELFEQGGLLLPPSAVQYQASLSRFVAPAPRGEVDEACMLADLSNSAYDVAAICEQHLATKHRLKLVKRSINLAAAAAAADMQQAAGGMPASPAAAAAAAVEAYGDVATALASPRSPRVSAFSVMTLEEVEEAEAAAAVAAGVAVDCLAEAHALPDVMGSPRIRRNSSSSSSSLSDQGHVSMQEAAQALSAVAAAAVARMAAAQTDDASDPSSSSSNAFLGGNSYPHRRLTVDTAAADSGPCDWEEQPDTPDSPIHPADWFVCDSEEGAAGDDAGVGGVAPTRYFVFQGSITLNHWRINLTFDPVPFEGSDSGFKVHRGVYLAAQQLYDTFVPLVQEHLARCPGGKVAFTGHSLGGSLATVLMLLLVYRGVLPPEAVSSVHTFGAPAVFCEGAASSAPTGGPCASCALPCEHKAAAVAAFEAASGISLPPPAASSVSDVAALGAQQRVVLRGLLEQLGLRPEVVRNVIMTRDIVPRAFVCDYTMVAEVLKSWMPSFKEHVGLAPCKPHKVLYNFLGAVEVLHPPLSCGFVMPGEGHFMLPAEAALYKLVDPDQPHLAAQQQQEAVHCSSSLSCSALTASSSSSSSGSPCCSGACASGSCEGGGACAQVEAGEGPHAAAVGADPLGLTLGDAILAFMNSPHPLETLGEWRAYGPDGSISRFHNPANYTRALESLQDLAAQ